MASQVCQHGHLRRACEICDLTTEIATLTARLEAAERVVEAAEVMMEVEDESCWYDHHGLCQSHNLRCNDAGQAECQVGLMRQALSAHRAAKGEQQ